MEVVLSSRPSSMPTRMINALRLRDEVGFGSFTVHFIWLILS
jgi:hypothetical protein